MKVILTGSTGYIGGEVLKQCLQNPEVLSVVILARREIPYATEFPKAKTIIVKDFEQYSDTALGEFQDANACIWSIGTYNGDQKVEVDYPTAFFKAIVKARSNGNNMSQFRYVHLGGAFTEADQDKDLWFLPKERKVRGLGETKMHSFTKAAESKGLWKSIVVKPAWIMSPQAWFRSSLQSIIGSNYCIRVEEAAAAMVDIAVHGSDKEIVSNHDLVLKGRQVLQHRT